MHTSNLINGSLTESQVQTKRTEAATLIGKDKMKDWFCSLNEREVKGETEGDNHLHRRQNAVFQERSCG